jgi:polar amino acid transport system substrate-binding protein
MALQGISDLPTRREVADFVNYLRTGSQFYTSTANAAAIKSQEDLCGKTVGASRSTNWPAKIEEWSAANCVAKGKPAIKVVGTEGSADARTQLKSGRIDAAVQGQETLPYSQKLEPNQYVLIGNPFTEDLMGIPFTKTDTPLRDAVKAAIERLQAKGVYDQILAKYGLQANAYKPITINQGK